VVAHSARLHLNAFRGEPAISEFAWHFTSTHRSSLQFASCTGAGLHERVPPASPCPWVAHPVSGRLDATHSRPFGLGFPPAPPVAGLTSPRPATRRLILQKARRHPTAQRQEAPTGRKRTVSGALSLPLNGVLFTVPSRYWFPIGRLWYLALGGGPPRFPPPTTWRAVLTRRSHAPDPSVAYGALTLSRYPFQQSSAARTQISARRLPPPLDRAFNPGPTAPAGSSRQPGLGSSPFARRY
jgi:hypothetical protein